MELQVSALDGTGLALTPASAVGVGGATEYVLDVTGDAFQARVLFFAGTPAIGIADDPLSCATATAWAGAYAYVSRPPSGGFTPTTAVGGAPITLEPVFLSDPDGPIPSHWSWDIDGDGEYGQAADGTPSVTFAAGTHELGLRIIDDDGASTDVRRTFVVEAPVSPPATPASAPPPTPAPAPLAAIPPPDRTRPQVSLKLYTRKLAAARRSGIRIAVIADEAVTGSFVLTLAPRYASRLRLRGAIGRVSSRATAGGSVTVVLTIRRTALRRLASFRSARFVLSGTARDRAGNSVRVSRTFRLG